MIILGIFLLVAGLIAFIWAGIKLNDAPGVAKEHLTPMLAGLVAIIIGGFLLYGRVFGAL